MEIQQSDGKIQEKITKHSSNAQYFQGINDSKINA